MEKRSDQTVKIQKTAHWSSMYDEEAPTIRLSRIDWIRIPESGAQFFPGEDTILLAIGLSGSGQIEAGDQKLTLSKNHAFLQNVKNGCLIRAADAELSFVYLLMCGALAERLLVHMLKDRGFIFSVGTEALTLCDEIYAQASAGWSYEREIRLSCLLYELCGCLLISHAHDETLTPSVSFMQEHFAEPVTTRQLADLCFLGTSQFIKRFHTAYGVPPKRYLNNLRISKAKELLRQSALPVNIIAQQVGFEDSSYFTRLFKNLTGETPRAYRNGGKP